MITHPVTKESRHMTMYNRVQVSGEVVALAETPYGKRVILSECWLEKRKLESKLMIYIPKDVEVKRGDWIKGEGTLEPLGQPMNPSDYHYGNWQRAQGVCGTMNLKRLEITEEGREPLLDIRTSLIKRIQNIFEGRDGGLINLLVLGEDGYAQEEILEAYYNLGVGHLLSISGFHLTTLIMGIWLILSLLRIPYGLRHGWVVVLIWSYALLVGMGIATVRACIVATILAIGRCLWQEEDLPTSLALAGGIIIWENPYVLGTPSFQLSFGAMVGVVVCQHVLRLISSRTNLAPFMGQIIGSLIISLVIFPIMAYHFFEVSLLGVVLNLLFIPVFSVVLPASFIIIGLSYLNFGLAYGVGYLLTSVLQCMARIALVGQSVEWGTWTIGRPSFLGLVVYTTTLILGILIIEQLVHKRNDYGVCSFLLLGILSIWLCRTLIVQTMPGSLEVTQLYVGQGDAAVIRTPSGQHVLIDAGKYGQGKTIKRFLNYKGHQMIDLVIVSHPHEDHIGGVLELLEMDMPIKGIVIGQEIESREANDLISQLKNLARQRNVPVYEIYETTSMKIGEVGIVFEYVAGIDDPNEASLMCLVSYGAYDHLFTGDIGERREGMIDNLRDIDVLKVAHHGSRYSTTEDFLLQTKPEYGMISSGENNLYQHPHDQTLSRLESHKVDWYDTKEVGAICVRTDGESLTIKKQIQKEPRIDDGDGE